MMTSTRTRTNSTERLRFVQESDGPVESTLGAIGKAAALVCGTEFALVRLTDGSRDWIGESAMLRDRRDVAFALDALCDAIEGRGSVLVHGRSENARFNGIVLATAEPRVRAFAGAPISLGDASVIGTLCVFDFGDKEFLSEQIEALESLAKAVAHDVMMQAAIASSTDSMESLEIELREVKRVAAVAQHSDDAIIGKSLDGMVTSWNFAAERIFGYSSTEMVGRPITVLFPPDRIDEERYLLACIHSGKSVPQFETVRVRKDGIRVHVSVSLSPIRNELGEIIAISKVVRDITVRREQERLLLESEARYRALVEDQEDLLSLSRPDGVIKFANVAFASFFGASVPTVCGTALASYAHLRDRAHVRAELAKAAGSNEAVMCENRWVDASGSDRWLSWKHRALRNDHGQVFAIHSVGRDVTARRDAEQALRANQLQLRKLYEGTPAMLYSCDGHGVLLTVSDVWLRKLGYSREEAIGRHASEFYAPECRKSVAARLGEDLCSRGEVEDLEAQMVRSDGMRIDVRLAGVLEKGNDGEPSHFLAVVQDVTEQRAAEQSLELHRERLAIATASNDIGIWELDIRTNAHPLSENLYSLFDCGPEVFRGSCSDWASCIHPEDLLRVDAQLRSAIETCAPLAIDFRVKTQSGEVRFLHARATVVTDASGKATRVFGVNYDVTTRALVERQLAEKNELLRVTLESIGDAVITTDAKGNADWLNPAAEKMTGWFTEEARGKPIGQVFSVLHQDSREPAENPVGRCLAEGATVVIGDSTVLVSRNGAEFGIQDSASPIRSADGEILGAVLVFHDVSEQRRLGREMSYRAKHDELTGLINRVEFELRLARLIEDAPLSGANHSLLYMDLDQFKLVNDACGHAAGDVLLKQLASLFQSVMRSRDTLARIGGDEFGVLLEHCSVDQANRVAEQICAQMEEFRFMHDGRRFRLGTSIGLVPIDARWSNTAAPLQAADSASYAAKEAGRNRVHVWFDTDVAMNERMKQAQWGSRLENALHEGRFELFGQRIEPLSELACVGGAHVEVLLRMREDDGTLISPGAFLSAAERFHMATRIDRWVVKAVLAWLASRPEMTGVDVVAINLSGQSMGDREFHRYVSGLLADSSVDLRRLCFEITETSAITNLSAAKSFVDAMRGLGVRVALDDFGAGASSFGYLKSLQVDYLKIDGQFVRDLNDDPLDLAAVRCFAEVAKVVGVKTIAEFVDSPTLLGTLREIGVDYVQGFTVHKPEPLSQAVKAALAALQA